jgi:hypothetical protein
VLSLVREGRVIGALALEDEIRPSRWMPSARRTPNGSGL